eukprot:3933419-Rhodomonas_salina.1
MGRNLKTRGKRRRVWTRQCNVGCGDREHECAEGGLPRKTETENTEASIDTATRTCEVLPNVGGSVHAEALVVEPNPYTVWHPPRHKPDAAGRPRVLAQPVHCPAPTSIAHIRNRTLRHTSCQNPNTLILGSNREIPKNLGPG